LSPLTVFKAPPGPATIDRFSRRIEVEFETLIDEQLVLGH
jgi:hypothetical protein